MLGSITSSKFFKEAELLCNKANSFGTSRWKFIFLAIKAKSIPSFALKLTRNLDKSIVYSFILYNKYVSISLSNVSN